MRSIHGVVGHDAENRPSSTNISVEGGSWSCDYRMTMSRLMH